MKTAKTNIEPTKLNTINELKKAIKNKDPYVIVVVKKVENKAVLQVISQGLDPLEVPHVLSTAAAGAKFEEISGKTEA